MSTLTTAQAIQASQYESAYHWNIGNRCEQDRYERLTKHLVKLITNEIGDQLNVPLLILDIGCGDGRSSYSLWNEFRQSGREVQVTGYDIDSRAIQWARELSASHGANDSLQFLNGSFTALAEKPHNEHSIIVGVLREVIEHLPDDVIDEILKHFAAVYPGALMIATTPMDTTPVEPKHLRHYTRELFQRTFQRNGFEVRYISGFSFRPAWLRAPLMWLKTHLGRRRLIWRLLTPCWRPVPPEFAITILGVAKAPLSARVSD